MSFLDTVSRAKISLREHGRVSCRGLKREFDLDDEVLDELIEELVDVQQVATWFTEGVDTRDLRAAKALLGELG